MILKNFVKMMLEFLFYYLYKWNYIFFIAYSYYTNRNVLKILATHTLSMNQSVKG